MAAAGCASFLSISLEVDGAGSLSESPMRRLRGIVGAKGLATDGAEHESHGLKARQGIASVWGSPGAGVVHDASSMEEMSTCGPAKGPLVVEHVFLTAGTEGLSVFDSVPLRCLCGRGGGEYPGKGIERCGCGIRGGRM